MISCSVIVLQRECIPWMGVIARVVRYKINTQVAYFKGRVCVARSDLALAPPISGPPVHKVSTDKLLSQVLICWMLGGTWGTNKRRSYFSEQ